MIFSRGLAIGEALLRMSRCSFGLVGLRLRIVLAPIAKCALVLFSQLSAKKPVTRRQRYWILKK